MIHESKIAFTKIDENGNDKVVKERYLIEEASGFGDAEEQTYEYCNGVGGVKTDVDVVDVKRSKVKEILNRRSCPDDNIFVGDVSDTQLNDDGEEVELVYKVSLFAKNFDDAYLKLNEYLKQGYAMQIVGVKKTKFVDIIPQ